MPLEIMPDIPPEKPPENTANKRGCHAGHKAEILSFRESYGKSSFLVTVGY